MHSYATDVDRSRVALVIGAGSVGVAYLAYLAMRSAGVSAPWWVAIPGPLAVAASVFTFYDRFAWRWHFGSLRLSAIPDLGGTWEGVIRSDFDNGAQEQTGELRISQRWTALQIRYQPNAGTSRSTSVVAAILTSEGNPTLVYEYANEPEPHAESTMAPHRGLARLQLNGAGQLSGDYFTGRLRKTVGDMDFRQQSPQSDSGVV